MAEEIEAQRLALPKVTGSAGGEPEWTPKWPELEPCAVLSPEGRGTFRLSDVGLVALGKPRWINVRFLLRIEARGWDNVESDLQSVS